MQKTMLSVPVSPFLRFSVSIIATLLCLNSTVHADGLSTSFVDVVVLDVPLGVPRLIQDKHGKGMIFHNLGNSSRHVTIQVLAPEPKELRGGAQPIPDVRWIEIQPDALELAPQGEADCRVIINVPPNKIYRNKLYQAKIWSRSAPQKGQGVTFEAGLMSRLRFRTAKKMQKGLFR